MDGGNFSGSMSNVLTFVNLSTANVGTYQVFITNSVGAPITSSSATLGLAAARNGCRFGQNPVA